MCKSQAKCRMDVALPTAHTQHLCRSERETSWGKMCQWTVDMRCLLLSYSVSLRGGTILLEAE